MPKGPHEARLDTYVAGGNVANIRHSALVWDRGHAVLSQLAIALDTAKPKLMDRFGPQTGPAAVAAFEKVAASVRAQAAEMERASSALTTAGDALEDAQTTHQKLGNAPASPPSDPTQKAGETAEAFHQRQRDANAAQSTYATESAERERQSQVATHDVDTSYHHAIQVMESIHGRPRTTSTDGGGSDGGSITGGGLPPRSGTTGGRTPHHSGTFSGAPSGPGAADPGGTDGGTFGGPHGGGHTDGGGGPLYQPPTYGDPGVPQGPGYSDPLGPGAPAVPGGGVPPGSEHVPIGHTATSAAVGGMLSGGIIGGTSSLSGAMRTSATSALTAQEEAAALGASRASGTGASESTTAARAGAGRGGAVGMTGRSGGASAGAGGRGGRGRKKKRPDGSDFYEDGDDWLDDDEASPPVLH